MPGRLLSQPARVTMPSNRSPCITHSTESAMISREESEARMPSVPIEMPSDTAMVVNSSGKPPAARTPSLAALARRASGRLQGVTSFHEEAMPTWERPQSPSPIPTARSMARAGSPLHPLGDVLAAWLVLVIRHAPKARGLRCGTSAQVGRGAQCGMVRSVVILSVVVLFGGACSDDEVRGLGGDDDHGRAGGSRPGRRTTPSSSTARRRSAPRTSSSGRTSPRRSRSGRATRSPSTTGRPTTSTR